MARRRMMGVKVSKSPRLPSEYQEVEWISPTDRNQILLDRKPFNGNAVIRCRYYKESQANSEQALIMARDYTGTCFEVGFSKTENLIFAFSAGGTSARIVDTLVYQNWVDLEAVFSTTEPTKKLSLTANGTTKTHEGSGVNKQSNNASIAVFSSPEGVVVLPAYVKIAYMQIFLNGVETYNLIPCYRKSDGNISMYDLVSNTFFTPYDWSKFSKGADVN